MRKRRKAPEKGAPTTQCGREIGAWLDTGVRRHILTCLNLLGECGKWLSDARALDFGAECQRRIVLNLGWCLHEAVYGMTILVDHDAWGSALTLERSALEYYGRAAYFAKHVDHAIWAVAVERLQVLIERAATPEERIRLTHELNQARRVHADLAPESRLAQGLVPFHRVRIADMIRDGVGMDGLRRYRSASLVLHGDLYASTLRRPGAATNAALLHAASGMVSMCNLMLSWVDKAPRGLTDRALAAEEETYRLSQRYEGAYLIDSAFEPEAGSVEATLLDDTELA